MIAAALDHIRKVDPTMRALIDAVGPFTVEPGVADPFRALVRSIVHQQLTGKAAAKILARVLDLVPAKGFPKPEQFLAVPHETLRAAGLSNAKAASLHDLARRAAAGELPTARRIKAMTDDEIVEALTEVRGIGRWSVEMFLIFNLARLDVLPATDYGVRKGFAKVYRKRALPEPKALLKFGERWRPYRTIPSWYLWRALELEDSWAK